MAYLAQTMTKTDFNSDPTLLCNNLWRCNVLCLSIYLVAIPSKVGHLKPDKADTEDTKNCLLKNGRL